MAAEATRWQLIAEQVSAKVGAVKPATEEASVKARKGADPGGWGENGGLPELPAGLEYA